jgi:hypothetical protein
MAIDAIAYRRLLEDRASVVAAVQRDPRISRIPATLRQLQAPTGDVAANEIADSLGGETEDASTSPSASAGIASLSAISSWADDSIMSVIERPDASTFSAPVPLRRSPKRRPRAFRRCGGTPGCRDAAVLARRMIRSFGACPGQPPGRSELPLGGCVKRQDILLPPDDLRAETTLSPLPGIAKPVRSIN